MADPGDGLRLQLVEDALARLASRVDTLERALAPARAIAESPPASEARSKAADPPVRAALMSSAVMFAGRTAIVLGGAYFLRALTEAGGVTRNVGVGLGFAYAGAWLGVADRAAVRRRSSSIVHGLTALLIAVPLLWEASTRFAVLTPSGSLMALSALTVAALVVAAHRDLPILAAVATLGALVTAAALAFAAGSAWPAASFFVLLGLAAWWTAERAGWPWLSWTPGLAAAVMTGLLVARSSPGHSEIERPGVAWVTTIVLVGGYLGSFAWRTLHTARPPRAFEIVESALVILVGALALATLPAGPVFLRVVGAGLTASGCVAYAGARAVAPSSAVASRYAQTIGLTSLVAGGSCLFAGTWLDVWWLVLGTGCVLGSRTRLRIPAMHALLFVVAAAVKTGLVRFVVATWIARTAAPAPMLLWPTLTVAALGLVLPPAVAARPGERTPGMPLAGRLAVRVTLAGIVIAGLSTLGVASALRLLAGTWPDEVLAAAGTVLLTVVGVACTLAGQRMNAAEWRWLGYAVLGVAGVQLVVEDLRVAAPSTLFAVLAAYGTALTIVSRLPRRDRW